MQHNVRTDCPKCSRPLQKFNGHIGYCSQHKWVSPAGLGFEAEAAEQIVGMPSPLNSHVLKRNARSRSQKPRKYGNSIKALCAR